MERLADLSPYTWIKEGTIRLAPGNAVTVAHCLPQAFAAYCKIFHPIYADPTVPDRTQTWADLLAEAARQHTSIPVELGKPTPEHRILWRSLIQQLGRQFHAGVTSYTLTRAFQPQGWPRCLIGPHEGTLDLATSHCLVEILTPFTGQQTCFFYYVIYATSTYESDLLYRGKLYDVLQTFGWEENVSGSPTYWWPEDKSWCLCTDYDLAFTLLGGSESLINTVLEDVFLESVRVTSTSRIDDAGDMINQ